MDGLVHQRHTSLSRHLANNDQLGKVQVSNQSRRRGPTVCATTGVEGAQAAGISQTAAVNVAEGGQSAEGGNPISANPIRGTTTAAKERGAAGSCPCSHRSNAQDAQMTQLTKALYRQTALISFLSLIFTFSCILPLASAQLTQSDNDHFIVFDQVGHMALSLGYINVAIPFNNSTYQHQISHFQNFLADCTTITTTNPTQVSFTKAIRDLAMFAHKRVNKLVEQLRFIDVVLQEDNLANLHHPRQKRFLASILAVMLPKIMQLKGQAKRDQDFFDENCNLKNPTISFEEMAKRLTYLPRSKCSFIEDKSGPRRHFQLMCYLNKTMQTTTPLPYPDYPEFHKVFANETYPTTATTTPPPPSHKVFQHLPTALPPKSSLSLPAQT